MGWMATHTPSSWHPIWLTARHLALPCPARFSPIPACLAHAHRTSPTHVHYGVGRRRVEHLQQHEGCTAQGCTSVPVMPLGRHMPAAQPALHVCPYLDTVHFGNAQTRPLASPPVPACSLVRNPAPTPAMMPRTTPPVPACSLVQSPWLNAPRTPAAMMPRTTPPVPACSLVQSPWLNAPRTPAAMMPRTTPPVPACSLVQSPWLNAPRTPAAMMPRTTPPVPACSLVQSPWLNAPRTPAAMMPRTTPPVPARSLLRNRPLHAARPAPPPPPPCHEAPAPPCSRSSPQCTCLRCTAGWAPR